MKKINLVFLFLFLIFSPANAQDLIIKEAKIYFNEGVEAQKEGNFNEAIKAYAKVLILDKDNLDYRKFIVNNRGLIYLSLDDIDNAEDCFNQALKFDPNYMPAKLNLGLIYDRTKDELTSIKYWFKAFDINLEELKPKAFVLEEGPEPKKKKK